MCSPKRRRPQMRALHRLTFAFLGLLFALAVSAAGYGQTPSKPIVLPSGAMKPGFVKMPKINVNDVQQPGSSIRLVLPAGVNSTRGMVVLKNANSTSGVGSFSKSAASKPGGEDNAAPNIA